MFRRDGSYLQAWGLDSLKCVDTILGAKQKWVQPYKVPWSHLVNQSRPDTVSAIVDAAALQPITMNEEQLPLFQLLFLYLVHKSLQNLHCVCCHRMPPTVQMHMQTR